MWSESEKGVSSESEKSVSPKFDQTHCPFTAKISHLNKEEQAEYEKAYEKYQAIQKEAHQITGKSWKLYKALKIKKDALDNNGRILEILVLRSRDRIEGGLQIPTTTRSATAEHEAVEEWKKAAKEAHKALHAAPVVTVKADKDYDADDEMD